jgi:Rrf2 family protein
MNTLVHLSESVSLAFHAAALIAGKNGGRLSVREIAGALEVSEAHLAKVLQNLCRRGVIKSRSGPGGGFYFTKNTAEIKLAEIFDAAAGKFDAASCLFSLKICAGNKCPLGKLIHKINLECEKFFAGTTVHDLMRGLTEETANDTAAQNNKN